MQTSLAQALAKANRLAEAQTTLTAGLKVAHVTQQHILEAEQLRVQGELLLQQAGMGASSQIQALYEQAITVAEQRSARLLVLRAVVSLARLWCIQGKRQQARDRLIAVYQGFNEGFVSVDLRAAKALLDELGGIDIKY